MRIDEACRDSDARAFGGIFLTELPSAPRPWTSEIGLRLRRYLALKLIGTTVFAWIFFIGYFHLLRHPTFPVTVMPLTALDASIPFQPYLLIAYLSLWVYVGVAPGLQLTLRGLLVYSLWMAALCASGLLCFYLWPTRVPPMMLDSVAAPGFALLRRVDAAGNACPSLHVAAAIFTAIRIEDVLRRALTPIALRLLNVAWFGAIAYSTLAVKQHVVLDLIAGALLGAVFALVSLRFTARAPGSMRPAVHVS